MNKSIIKKLEANIWKFYIYQMFCYLAFFLPVAVLFWQDNGLSMMEIMLLQSIFSVVIVFLEIPTGYFADIYGRKKSLIFASICAFISMSVYSIGINFYHFLVAEIFWGFAMSLMSGSDSAFIYDTLAALNRENQYKKIWGHSIFMMLIANACANIIGGFIGMISFRLTFVAMLPFLLAMIPLSLSMVEPERNKLIFKEGYTHKLIKIIKEYLLENTQLKWLIIYAAVIVVFTNSILWFYQPYFSYIGLKTIHFGFIFASLQVVAAISSKYAHKSEHSFLYY